MKLLALLFGVGAAVRDFKSPLLSTDLFPQMRHQHVATQLRGGGITFGGIGGFLGGAGVLSGPCVGGFQSGRWRETVERESTNWRGTVERESTNWRGESTNWRGTVERESTNWRGTIRYCVAMYCAAVTGKWLGPDVFRVFRGRGTTGDDASTTTTTTGDDASTTTTTKDEDDEEDDQVLAPSNATTSAIPLHGEDAHDASLPVPRTTVLPTSKEPLAVPHDGLVGAATAPPTNKSLNPR